MVQCSILEWVGVQRRLVQPEDLFVDLFCGLGGASEGAREAGMRVDLAVDSDPEMLQLHALNHPGCAQVCATLPDCSLEFPISGQRWWLHGSPPCTKVSEANQDRDDDDRSEAVEMVTWFLKFAMDSSALWWSMEQVATPVVVQALEALRHPQSPYRRRFAYTVIDFYDIGVPQNRRRLLAGSPDVIAALQRAPTVHRCVRDVVDDPGGTHLRNKVWWMYCKKGDAYQKTLLTQDQRCRPLDMPSFCITATPLRWATPPVSGHLRHISVRQTARLQTFPDSYNVGALSSRARLGLANAVPPLVMQTIVQQASQPR